MLLSSSLLLNEIILGASGLDLKKSTSTFKYFESRGHAITTVDIGFLDHESIKLLIPWVSNVKTLILDVLNTEHAIEAVHLLHSTARPLSIYLGAFDISDCTARSNFLVPILQIPQLALLRSLRFSTIPSEYGTCHLRGRIAVADRNGEKNHKLKELVSKCRAKGVSLKFCTEREEDLWKLNESVRRYNDYRNELEWRVKLDYWK